MKSIGYLVLSAALAGGVSAQEADIPFLTPREKEAVEQQTGEFNRALSPVLAEAAKSTVRVWSGKRRLAYGTVVGDGRQVLTKWSEIANARTTLRIQGESDEVRAVTVTGVYEDDDLALLDVEGVPLVPVKWDFEKPVLGRFLAAPQPDGTPAAFGVVSVLERNLLSKGKAFLGVGRAMGFEGPGVKIGEIEPKSGAEVAGMKTGDIILQVEDRKIAGFIELQSALAGIAPGSSVRVLVERGGKEMNFEVTLGDRGDIPRFPDGRLRQMEEMGGPISRVRDTFSRAIQSDMRPSPSQIGGPVVDLKGRVLGITVARADRTKSFVMPSAAVAELLRKPPSDPALARVGPQEREQAPALAGGPGAGQGMAKPKSRKEMRKELERNLRHLSDLQRLTDRLDTEMRDLEPGR